MIINLITVKFVVNVRFPLYSIFVLSPSAVVPNWQAGIILQGSTVRF